jgi:SPP1 gp7 family putative phage head morphogenesis protein
MAERYGQDYRNCERLARTETIHFMNQATHDSYREHGVEKYQFVCGLDERTCPTCGALDGTVHDVRYKEEGVNYPVMHPNCYDDKTEVLTREGWKLFRECSDDDEYFSMNPDNPGETDYLKALARISDRTLMILEFRYGRKLVRVTENHDMLMKYDGKLHFMEAKNLLSLSSNAVGRDIFILDDKLEEIPLSDFSCTLEQGWFSVYCVELPKWHTLLVRRDGAGVWSGNCRCTTIPFFEKDDIDALFEESTRVAYDEGRKIYDVPASMTYKEWFETLGSDKKEAILGKSRYEMHVNGVPLSDFVKNGKLVPLSEVRSR